MIDLDSRNLTVVAVDQTAPHLRCLTQFLNGNGQDIAGMQRLANGAADAVDQVFFALLSLNGAIGPLQLVLPYLEIGDQPLRKRAGVQLAVSILGSSFEVLANRLQARGQIRTVAKDLRQQSQSRLGSDGAIK